jgi:hypothetical protein
MLMNLTGIAGTFPVRRSGLTLECGAPVPLWIWYDVTNIQSPSGSNFSFCVCVQQFINFPHIFVILFQLHGNVLLELNISG